MVNLDKAKMEEYAASLSSIQEAQRRISPFVQETPLLTSSSLDHLAQANLYFKCELFQRGGAYKFRGASNAVLSLPDDVASKGVITHSSGNHAAAVALVAKMRGIPAWIVMPHNAPKCKVESVKRYGGSVCFVERCMDTREEACRKLQAETGGSIIHPFNDARTISGQGTIGLELLEKLPQLDAIVVPISGGSLISGISVAAKAIKPAIKIFGVEPTGADDVAQSKAAGKLVILSQTSTIADALRGNLGPLTWPIARDLVDDVITVSDEEIVRAMRMCYEILKVVVEPSGAAGLAAVLSTKVQSKRTEFELKHIAIILTGGNVDLSLLSDFFKGN
ncbi:hypothetical protein GOP47_0011191 [Adiantum capillus-veneris]|uniref:Serine racemase n=1 Tax=Adiantum capillus-veneris TaxID=13818 RepID=A0A9D4ZF61_ADICA|nr:hypothetical protein GOP47_0011191 [Adiantum capillus-veneris]